MQSSFLGTTAVQRACIRSASAVRCQLTEGLTGLAIITSVAPLLGLLATLDALTAAFGGCVGERSACLAALINRASYALWPANIGLFVGLCALAMYRVLSRRLDQLALEMQVASWDLANWLSRSGGRLVTLAAEPHGGVQPMFGRIHSCDGQSTPVGYLHRRRLF